MGRSCDKVRCRFWIGRCAVPLAPLDVPSRRAPPCAGPQPAGSCGPPVESPAGPQMRNLDVAALRASFHPLASLTLHRPLPPLPPLALAAGLQMRNLDATALRASFHMLADYFPERMHKVFMVDGALGWHEGRGLGWMGGWAGAAARERAAARGRPASRPERGHPSCLPPARPPVPLLPPACPQPPPSSSPSGSWWSPSSTSEA